MNLAVALSLFLALAPAAPATVISHGAGSSPTVALTFDAGADRGYALSILQTLERNRIHATFGMTGTWARANPDLLRRMSRDHDQIINHTYDHRSFTGLSSGAAPLTTSQRVWEIEQADRVVRRITGRTTKPYFRPPFGDYDQATLALLSRLGYRYMVMWSLDSLGWEHLPPASILQRCLAQVTREGIIVMHVGSQSQDAAALPPLIHDLKRRGYRFSTVAELIHRH